MAKKRLQSKTIDFPFYSYLQNFIEQERKRVYMTFKPLTRKILSFNNPNENKTAFLRPPQFEALEMYIFLKEFCENRKLWQVFEEWYNRNGIFEGRRFAGRDIQGQGVLFGVAEDGYETTKETFVRVFSQIKSMQQEYPNFIFALTMGLGKTVLMATSIFYEFILANKYPKNELYCHNALVFAPDKTVLQSLKEIQTFDKSKVIPAEYLNWLETNLKFYFLDESGDTLNAIENSKYNIIISNTQKIILKRDRKAKTPTQTLFGTDASRYKAISIKSEWEKIAEDAGIEDIDTELELTTNQRFFKLLRLKQLGIYVDEAHHIFGTKLSEDLTTNSKATSLRVTINELSANLSRAGSRVVACYNYTGTPYVGNRLLPEVVYSYGLQDAICNGYLKKVDIKGYENIKDRTIAFCRIAISSFWERIGQKRVEDMLPKLAFFASSIDELQNELRPAVEQVLIENNIPVSKILVNVGDDRITSNDDLREFKNLDTPNSNKQFILLVNKGKEGWNCRSLFGVALHREPKSKVFVLQATMRCLRQIGDYQHTALVFLSDENTKILDNELQENFNVTLTDINNKGEEDNHVEVRIVPPPISIKINRVRKLFNLREKRLKDHIDFELDSLNLERYKIKESNRSIFDLLNKIGVEKDVSEAMEKVVFTELTMIAEIARYLNISPICVKNILTNSKEGIAKVCESINMFNEILYDEIIPRLFHELYDVEEYEHKESVELCLVKEPKDGYYLIKYKDGLLASLKDTQFSSYGDKSFNLDNYCFDSKPEINLFWTLLRDNRIDKVWFTGMLTHGQTEFFINYIDPISGGVRAYHPDFLVKMKDGSYTIVEVKGDNMIDDEIVRAKSDYAKQIAYASNMSYCIMKGSDANLGMSI